MPKAGIAIACITLMPLVSMPAERILPNMMSFKKMAPKP
ncbi:Uncharacterised protein [Mycobacteroides abscessus subsp. massiliense]|nr:Uncharacterised protein [Mycobacteroides abscessus subsp. massiliense]